MDGHGTSPKERCEGIPDPSEVSKLGKLRRNFVLDIIQSDQYLDFEGHVPAHNFITR